MEYHIKKDLNYYNKKINNYLTLINSDEQLTDKEKEIIEKKLSNLLGKLEMIKKSEVMNIENINNKQKQILKERLFNQYKAYLTNKNIYLSNKCKENKDFKYLNECFDFINSKKPLNKTVPENCKLAIIFPNGYLFPYAVPFFLAIYVGGLVLWQTSA